MNENVYIEWTSLIHEHKPKSLEWYRYALYIGGAFFLISLLLKNFLFSLFILLATSVLFVIAQKPPEEKEYALTTHGVRAGTLLYPHRIIHTYSLNEHDSFPHLVLQSDKTFSPYIIIPLGETDWGLVREYFREYEIDEVPHEPTFFDWVAERIGF